MGLAKDDEFGQEGEGARCRPSGAGQGALSKNRKGNTKGQGSGHNVTSKKGRQYERIHLQETSYQGTRDDEEMEADGAMDTQKLFKDLSEEERQPKLVVKGEEEDRKETPTKQWLQKKKEEAKKKFGENFSPLWNDNSEYLPGGKLAGGSTQEDEEGLFNFDNN
mmetsp:Transcript_11582/g.24712  ORF Transcript_11582/g.24712 Transcript_11582/m.24712 type:complete len:164 (+) Transcript_11582:590-1081(+)